MRVGRNRLIFCGSIQNYVGRPVLNVFVAVSFRGSFRLRQDICHVQRHNWGEMFSLASVCSFRDRSAIRSDVVSGCIIEDGIHLVLEDWDIGWLGDM